MHSRRLSSSIAPFLRRQGRSLAWLLIVAVFLQVMAMGVARAHALRGLLAGARPVVVEHCHQAPEPASTSGDVEDAHSAHADSEHCPFCRLSSVGMAPPSSAVLSFALPVFRARYLLVVDAGSFARAPDMRHAPKRAPPGFLL